MEVNNETIDDLLEVINSLIKENTILKTKLELHDKHNSMYSDDLYDGLGGYRSPASLKDLFSSFLRNKSGK